MIYDRTPDAGAAVCDLGDGVIVVERTPPRTAGAVWIAPYSVNCAEHGWIVSRRTADEAAGEGRAHLSVHAACELGAQHRADGLAPFGDLADGGSALLMDALGETGPTTEANHACRLALCEAYAGALAEG